jgi:hypothetical protein
MPFGKKRKSHANILSRQNIGAMFFSDAIQRAEEMSDKATLQRAEL